MRRLLEGGAYFNVDTQRSGAYSRAPHIWGPAFIRGNTVSTFKKTFCPKQKNKILKNSRKRVGGVAIIWYQKVRFWYQRRYTKFYYKDTLQNLNMYASANKQKTMYLTLFSIMYVTIYLKPNWFGTRLRT